jgi:hypothetical protein
MILQTRKSQKHLIVQTAKPLNSDLPQRARVSVLDKNKILNQIFLNRVPGLKKRAIKKQGQMMTQPFSEAFQHFLGLQQFRVEQQ